MRQAENFIFDGVSSEDMGVRIVSIDSGIYDEPLLSSREIVETEVAGRSKPYLQRVDKKPLSFPLTIFIEEWRERNNIRQIVNWLFKNQYKPLIFDSNLDRIYYAIFNEDTTLHHNGARDGYFTFNVRCDSPYMYSYPQTIEATSGDEIIVYNTGDIAIKPKLWIKKSGDGDIEIINETINQRVKIENLRNGEEVFVDFENEEIVSSLEYLNVYRFDDHNGEWLELSSEYRGENILRLVGDFEATIEYEMKYKTSWE